MALGPGRCLLARRAQTLNNVLEKIPYLILPIQHRVRNHFPRRLSTNLSWTSWKNSPDHGLQQWGREWLIRCTPIEEPIPEGYKRFKSGSNGTLVIYINFYSEKLRREVRATFLLGWLTRHLFSAALKAFLFVLATKAGAQTSVLTISDSSWSWILDTYGKWDDSAVLQKFYQTAAGSK